jgi:hypothetical protein
MVRITAMEYDDCPQEGIIIEYVEFLIRKKNYGIANEFLATLSPSPLRVLLAEKVARYIAFSSTIRGGQNPSAEACFR